MPDFVEMCHDSTRSRRGAARFDGRPDATHGRRWRDPSKRRRQGRSWRLGWWTALACTVLLWASPAGAALLEFENCLSKSILGSDPLQLQYVPLDVAVTFNLTDPLHPLNITIYGNVSGTADRRTNYPPMNDPLWNDPNSTVGKIVDLSSENYKYSTLLTSFDILSFTPYKNPSRFCDSLIQGDCPLGPVFDYNL